MKWQTVIAVTENVFPIAITLVLVIIINPVKKHAEKIQHAVKLLYPMNIYMCVFQIFKK